MDQDIVVTNSGGVTVTGLAATASGDFAVDATSPCLTGPLAAGDSCEIQVSFRPTAAGLAHRRTQRHEQRARAARTASSLSGDGPRRRA